TSTKIQFSWKPQGGTGDSPYTVSLRGKSGEMKRILNETSTAFEDLLSDYQYQISVDVSSCSQNVSASLTVQTAAEVYSGTTRITNKEFKAEYQNKSSQEFKDFETKFIAEITKHLPEEMQDLINKTKLRIVINSIKNGSVVVNYDAVFDVGHNITDAEIPDAFTRALNMSTEFKIDPENTVIEARNSCQPTLNDCSQHAACTAEGATYSCQCNEGFTDNSPRVPGRDCQQDLPSLPPQNETTGFIRSTTAVPPQNETTGFIRSTSNSISTPTFTPAPCMPVSIEVQKVTGEGIELSWTGGSPGSSYHVSLMDGNQVKNMTTEETKAVFKNLLPGHVYNISVAVSACAGSNQSSVTVRTDPASCFDRTEFCLPADTGCSDIKEHVCSDNQAFACNLVLNQTFNNTLYNSASADYKAMSKIIETDVVREMRIELKDDHFNIIVLGIKPGSVIVDFISLLPKEEPINVNVLQTQLSQVMQRNFGDQIQVEVRRK
ncbi:UROL1 protein, partial [Campylorhamphus procurvoides]|nr:UROL1 protein [Campylorhamphus procurvoides]